MSFATCDIRYRSHVSANVTMISRNLFYQQWISDGNSYVAWTNTNCDQFLPFLFWQFASPSFSSFVLGEKHHLNILRKIHCHFHPLNYTATSCRVWLVVSRQRETTAWLTRSCTKKKHKREEKKIIILSIVFTHSPLSH